MNSSRRSHTRLRFEDKKLDIGLEITEWIVAQTALGTS